MGFEPQVMRIVENVRPDRQTVMFSATFPRQMEALARRILSKPIEIQVGGRSVVCKDIDQHVVVLDDEMKFYKLLEQARKCRHSFKGLYEGWIFLHESSRRNRSV
jgi:ATP-dependent RNA helicase DDX46/PRP5